MLSMEQYKRICELEGLIEKAKDLQCKIEPRNLSKLVEMPLNKIAIILANIYLKNPNSVLINDSSISVLIKIISSYVSDLKQTIEVNEFNVNEYNTLLKTIKNAELYFFLTGLENIFIDELNKFEIELYKEFKLILASCKYFKEHYEDDIEIAEKHILNYAVKTKNLNILRKYYNWLVELQRKNIKNTHNYLKRKDSSKKDNDWDFFVKI